MYLFDSDTYSKFLRGNEFIKRRLSRIPPGSVFLCAITPEEVLRGRLDYINQLRTRQSPQLPVAYDLLLDIVRDLNRFTVLRYDNDADQIFRAWPAALKRAGSQDCRIAAVAQANGFVVVTSNTVHFAKIGIAHEDWNLPD